MPMRTTTAIILLAAALAPGPVHAWDDIGHRVVARIAWRELRPETRARVVALLRAAPEDAGLHALFPADDRDLEAREREFFARAATWADAIRDRELEANRYHRPTWHYVNFFWSRPAPDAPAELLDWPLVGELLAELERIRVSLGAPDRPAAERAVDLAWLLHLVGDLHQPLHCTARVTPQEPEGDRGGNLFGLGEGDNLHYFWDSILTRRFDRHEGEADEALVDRIADTIVQAHPRSSLAAELALRDVRAWARESVDVVLATAYPATLQRGVPPDAPYTDAAYAAAERRIALAGYRLADLLEELLGS